MDVDERAERYAQDHAPTRLDGVPLPSGHHHQLVDIVRDAYLAGAMHSQTDGTA